MEKSPRKQPWKAEAQQTTSFAEGVVSVVKLYRNKNQNSKQDQKIHGDPKNKIQDFVVIFQRCSLPRRDKDKAI